MKWFGQSWGAPICEVDTNAETPIGAPCARCLVAIAAGDRGFILPLVSLGDALRVHIGEEPWHLACFCANVGVEPPDGG